MRAFRIGRAHAGLLILAIGMGASAQGTKQDYERAESLGERVRDRVFRDRVRPRWIEGGPRFWYQVSTGPDTHEFVFVDPEAGTREPAFDHERLAESLAGMVGKPMEAGKLPLNGLTFENEGKDAVFRAGGERFRLDRESGVLSMEEEKEETGQTTRPGTPRRSRSNGPELFVEFENLRNEAVQLFWLDLSGERKAYGQLAPGGERRQHTFEGHVWQVAAQDGRELLRVEAGRDGDRFVILGSSENGQQDPDVETRGGRGRDARRSMAVSPDGRWEARIEDQNLWIRSTLDNTEFALTTDGSSDNAYRGDVRWSPNSRYVVAMQVEPAEEHLVQMVESSPRDQTQPRLKTVRYLKPGDRIEHPRPRLFDVEARQCIPISESLFPNPWSLDRLRWEDDSSRFTMLYNQRGHQARRLLSVDAASGDVMALVDEQSPTFIDYAHKTELRWLSSGQGFLWMSERSGWNHLERRDARTGKLENEVTRGEWVVRRVEGIDEEKGRVWIWAMGMRPGEDPYHEHLAWVNLDGTHLVRVTEGDGTHRVEFSPNGAYLVDTWSRVDQPPVTELRRSEDGSLVCVLERADASRLLEQGWTMPERFSAKGRDGKTDIYGVIYRPSNFDASRMYPVVEQIYAGPHDFHVPKAWGLHIGQHELAELGFVVVQIDGMGTNWRSKTFHDVCWKNLGDAGFPDRIAWMKAAAESRPWMDLTRVGLFGGSAGGQNALGGLLRHPDFYKAGAADCGCHDNRMDKIWWNELWMGWPVGPEYAENSNVTQAHKLQGKLLLMVGELDTNVDPASTMQVVNALIRADKDFELIVFPGAGHGAGGSAYGRRRQRDFFVRSLLGVEPRREAPVEAGHVAD